MRPVRLFLAALVALPLAVFAQTLTPKDFGPDGQKSDVLVAEEAKQVVQLVHAYKQIEALPLAEDLVMQRPRKGEYHEFLGNCLSVAAAREDDKAKSVKLWERARNEYRAAQTLGDNSTAVRVALEIFGNQPFDQSEPPAPKSIAEKLFSEGEKKFAQRDMEGAFELYRQAAEADPKMYKAALYAGDASFAGEKFDRAAEWFAKAIAINPSVETAYRYWGDALMKQGKQKEACEKYIEAVIANPYTNLSWAGLERYGKMTGIKVYSPQIKMPEGPTEGKPGKDGKQNINITMAFGEKDDPSSSAWLMYQMGRALWRDDEARAKKSPTFTGPYRHSLYEEADAIRLALSVVKEQKIPESKLDSNLRQLIQLDRDGVLEAWILLNHADQGILQDYAAYRETHRPQLRAYIQNYVIHAN